LAYFLSFGSFPELEIGLLAFYLFFTVLIRPPPPGFRVSIPSIE